MALDISTIRAQLTSHAQALGYFGQVIAHEPVSPPGSGLTYAVWLGDIAPAPEASGLASTSARIMFNGRIYMPADSEPMDDVDTQVTNAVDGLMGAYMGDFQLGGTVRNLDVFGQHGERMRARYGYLPLGSTTYRIATVNLPMIVNDVWTQVA